MIKKLSNNEINSRSVKNVILFLLFYVIFYYYFVIVPPIGDRWMEGVAYYDMGSVWQYLWSLVSWCKIANGRFLSNIFSVIVDRNIPFRAFCNAGMISMIAVLIFKICKIQKIEIKLIIYSLFFLVSWGIHAEVYLYATTLYISGLFLLFVVFYYMNKELEKEVFNHRILFLFSFVGCIWIENISVAIFMLVTVLMLAYSIKNKVLNKTFLYATLVSGVGLLFLYLDAKFASNGRLNDSGILLSLKWDRVAYLINSNILFVILLSILCLSFLGNKQKEVNKINKILCLLQYVWWCLILLIGLVCLFNKFYNLISRQPENSYVMDVFGWETFSSWTFEQIIRIGLKIINFVLPYFVCICLLSCVYIIFKSKNSIKGFCILTVMVSGALISTLGLEWGDRTSVPSVFATILFIGYLLQEVEGVIRARNLKIICICVSLAALFSIEDTSIVLKKAIDVKKERDCILKIVRERQLMDEWDYEQWVTIPMYDKWDYPPLVESNALDVDVSSKGLYGGNPVEESSAYFRFLRYYGLDENTKIKLE